jgi:hypothetical protein
VIRAAGKARRVDLALLAWKAAVEDIGQKMCIDLLGALLAALIRCASNGKIDKYTM